MIVKISTWNKKGDLIELHFVKLNCFYDAKEYLYNYGYVNINSYNGFKDSYLDYTFSLNKVNKKKFYGELEIITIQNSFRNDFNKIKIINKIKG